MSIRDNDALPSPDEGPGAGPGAVRLLVNAPPDAEIHVFGGGLDRRAYGVGQVDTRLAEGLYKIRSVRGGAAVERLVDLQDDTQLYLTAEPVTAIAPVGPVYGQWSAEIEALAREAIDAAAADRPPGDGSTILLMAHRDAEGLADPLAEAILYRWLEMHVRAKAGDAGRERLIGTEWWSAWAVVVEPGCYQIEFGGGALRQALLAVPGYDTRVFIRRSGPRAVPVLPAADLKELAAQVGDHTSANAAPSSVRTEISVQMAEPRSDIFYRDHFETIEVARQALETERPIMVQPQLVDQLLHGKWGNPVMGLMGAHLFLAGLERDRDPGEGTSSRPVDLHDQVRSRAAETLHTVLKNLDEVFTQNSGALPSDLVALHLRARPFTGDTQDFGTISEPPLFWASWEALLRHSLPQGPVAISRQLYSRVARAYPAGPYFAWRSGPRLSIERQMANFLIRSPALDLAESLLPVGPAVGLAALAARVALDAGLLSYKGVPMLDQEEIGPDGVAMALGAPRSLVQKD